MPGNIPNPSQERRVLQVLQEAQGQWINGQYFLRVMMLSQYHRAIWNLQHRRERYGYDGEIQTSDFTDEHGFRSYRLHAPEWMRFDAVVQPGEKGSEPEKLPTFTGQASLI
jgi:hypothetical protein